MVHSLEIQGRTASREAGASAAFLEELFEGRGPREFSVRFWDGSQLPPQPAHPERFTLKLTNPAALRSMFWPPDTVSLGESYIYGDFDVDGDLGAMFDAFDQLKAVRFSASKLTRLAALLLTLPAAPAREARGPRVTGALHSRGRDQQAISYHYDVGNDFYSLWLDDAMVYSCAYFDSPECDLGQAQHAKLDHICKKLRLQPGDKLLDIGCGWGALMAHAAWCYGAEVHGITLSEEQAKFARERFERMGLSDRCTVELKDYREVGGVYDKIASVGMFEHVGRGQLSEYFDHAYQLLAPGGVFLNHGISAKHGSGPWKSRSFINRYVFPDGELLPVSETLDVAEASGFEVRDVEGLREHYATTLRHWVARLEEKRDAASSMVDDVTLRIWKLYMAGAAHGFETGSLGVYQTLLGRTLGGPSGLPPTRADWYVQPAAE